MVSADSGVAVLSVSVPTHDRRCIHFVIDGCVKSDTTVVRLGDVRFEARDDFGRVVPTACRIARATRGEVLLAEL